MGQECKSVMALGNNLLWSSNLPVCIATYDLQGKNDFYIFND